MATIQLDNGFWDIDYVLSFGSAKDFAKFHSYHEDHDEAYLLKLYELAQSEVKPKKEKQVKGAADES